MNDTVITNSKLMAHMLAVRYADIIEKDGEAAGVQFAHKYVTREQWDMFCEYAEDELISRGHQIK